MDYEFFKYTHVSIIVSEALVLIIVRKLVSQKLFVIKTFIGCINSRMPSNSRTFGNSLSNKASWLAGQAPMIKGSGDLVCAAVNTCVFFVTCLVGCYFPGARPETTRLRVHHTFQALHMQCNKTYKASRTQRGLYRLCGQNTCVRICCRALARENADARSSFCTIGVCCV